MSNDVKDGFTSKHTFPFLNKFKIKSNSSQDLKFYPVAGRIYKSLTSSLQVHCSTFRDSIS